MLEIGAALAGVQLLGSLFGGESEQERQARELINRLTQDYIGLRKENDGTYQTAFERLAGGRSQSVGELQSRKRDLKQTVSGIYGDAATQQANAMRMAMMASAAGRNFDIGGALSQINQNLGQNRARYESELNQLSDSVARTMLGYDSQSANLSSAQANNRNDMMNSFYSNYARAIGMMDNAGLGDRLAAGIGGGMQTFANFAVGNYYMPQSPPRTRVTVANPKGVPKGVTIDDMLRQGYLIDQAELYRNYA